MAKSLVTDMVSSPSDEISVPDDYQSTGFGLIGQRCTYKLQ